MTTYEDSLVIRARLLPEAIEEEKKNWVTRAWGILLIVIGLGYVLGFYPLLVLYSATVKPLPFIETNLFNGFVLSVPAAFSVSVGIVIAVLSSRNTVMELGPGEIEQIEGSSEAWHNLPTFGRTLLAVFASAFVLGMTAIILRVTYKFVV